MTFANLTKPQWDAAHEAARIMMSSSPNRADDRLAYITAETRLAQMLPPDADARALIREAADWQMRNHIAAVVEGIPA
jgi:hypothetical protein